MLQKNKRFFWGGIFFPMQKQNIPSDYEIPVSYIPKEVVSELDSKVHTLWFNMSYMFYSLDLLCFFPQAGTCWVVLNIYPLEQSLRKLAGMFGSISSNREHIVVFITMLKSLRFTFDHEELVSVFSSKGTAAISHTRIASLIYLCAACCWLIAQETAMQVFQCHYREGSLMSGLYFDHIKDVLHAASQGTSGFSCKPPPCLNLQNSPGTSFYFEFMHFWWSPRKSKAA